MKKLSKLAITSVLSCLLSSAYAQQSQLSDVSSDFARGFGPESMGIAPGASFTKIYGTLDLSLNSLHTANSSLIRMQSGNAWTSKLGVYSQEYLGDGTTVFMRLESGFMANTGAMQTSTSLFNRGAFVGINDVQYGKVSAGHQYGAIGGAALMMDPFLANGHESPETYLSYIVSDLGRANADALSRTDSTLVYTTPLLAHHFVGYASQAFNSNQTKSTTHARSLAMAYLNASNQVSIGYSQGWCDPGVTGSCADTTVAPSVRTDIMLASVTHDFGPLLAALSYQQIDSQYASDPIARFYILGLDRKSGSNLYRAAVAYRDTTKANDHAWASTIGVDHFLSLRTALYCRFSYLKNASASALTYNYDATAGGIASVPAGSGVSSITLGMYHHF